MAETNSLYQFVNAGIERRILAEYKKDYQHHIYVIRRSSWSIIQSFQHGHQLLTVISSHYFSYSNQILHAFSYEKLIHTSVSRSVRTKIYSKKYEFPCIRE